MPPEKKRRRRKRCRFCGQLFIPDPRLKGTQYACSASPCQRQRKSANQRRWLSRNPDYFRGRYANSKAWLRSHPGYLARYRRQHPEKIQGDNAGRKRRHLRAKYHRADIQVAKSFQEPVSKALAPVLAGSSDADIQDSFLPQVIVTSLFSALYLERARADRQDSIASPPAAGYFSRHELHQKTPAVCGSSP